MSSAARATTPPQAPAAATAFGRPQRRFTVAEYHKLMDVGIVKKGDRCELIHGLLVEKPRIKPPHATAIRRLTRHLTLLFGVDAAVRVQLPITLSDSEPEPDAVLAVGTDDDYTARHPGPGDVSLAVEVSDSTLHDDRTTKLALYAAAKLPVYWIVNLPDRRVEVHTLPRGGKSPAYRQKAEYGPGDAVPVVVGGRVVGSIPVNDLLS